MRVAPSASGSQPGSTIGSREIQNRMQMILNTMDIYGAYPTYIQIYLNAQLSANAAGWQNVGGSSLAQYIFHTSANPVTITGGEVIYATYLNTVGGTNLTTTTVDLTQVRDLGNSVLGGGYAASQIGVYPDGPDTITVVGTNLFTSPANTYVRLAWTEAQA